MKKVETILLVGSEGFLGKNLVRLLIEHNYNIIGLDIQPTNNVKYTHFVQKNIFDLSINDISFLNKLNSYGVIYTGGVSRNGIAATYPIESSQNTVSALVKLLELLNQTTPPTWMMLTSTREVDILLDNKESLFGKQKIYSTLKLTSELIIESYSEYWNIPLKILRLSDIFGIGDHKSKVIQIFLNKAIQNDIIEVNNTNIKLFLTEVTEISSTIFKYVKKIEDDIEINNFEIIQLWDDNYYITLLELAYISLELNPYSQSKILTKDGMTINYSVKNKIKPNHMKVLENMNKLNIINLKKSKLK
ncbi:NAD-dependent epimerase/dehydratase family protein [Sulfurimonas lithotrophica]|uniref:NAD-dependent epimerase/dehydratase family protein n=1 Tax=Sulfurimonas lithotrophica TaxID=2590022 RepID=A0A5P8NY71_9BACT|nr:NAD-dependent epimerase/dehydratase family protein [Sulfurimonas lithotrophica]QFR48354.1 NAD-dependent epimerase/dehydratase family protein [Sulfurimonas lithotrophica]